MNPQTTKYYVIIVHFGPETTTKQAIASWKKSALKPEKIVIVDHARTPFTASDPDLHIIRPQSNRGYAAGLNVGLGSLVSLGALDTDIVIMMNNDITVYPNTLTAIDARIANLRHGNWLLGPHLDENNRPVSGQSYVNLLTGRARLGSPKKILTLPYIHGAFFAAPFGVLLSVQGLPTQYFLYWEDIHFSQKLRAKKIQLLVSPRVQVKHQTAAAAEMSPSKLYYLVRNGAYFLEHFTPRPWPYYWWLANRLRLVYHHFASRRPEIKQALIDARQHRLGRHNFQ